MLKAHAPFVALSVCLKTVASAILADVELGFQPGGDNVARAKSPVKFDRFRHAGDYSGRQDASLLYLRFCSSVVL